MPPGLTWEGVRAGLARAGGKMGEWAGLPMPMEGMRMIVHPSYPFADRLGEVFMPRPAMRFCRNSDVIEETAIRNSWASFRDGRFVTIWQQGTQFHFTYSATQNSAPMLVETLGAARAWDFEAEVRAMETLRRHVTDWAYRCYILTGSFLESSKRSGVTYLFRRLRPTVALTSRPDRRDLDVGVRILCTLCAHPVGYYEGTWAGALVPTDDVIAHLLMMRSDEHYYWRVCNQHSSWAPESGL